MKIRNLQQYESALWFINKLLFLLKTMPEEIAPEQQQRHRSFIDAEVELISKAVGKFQEEVLTIPVERVFLLYDNRAVPPNGPNKADILKNCGASIETAKQAAEIFGDCWCWSYANIRNSPFYTDRKAEFHYDGKEIVWEKSS